MYVLRAGQEASSPHHSRMKTNYLRRGRKRPSPSYTWCLRDREFGRHREPVLETFLKTKQLGNSQRVALWQETDLPARFDWSIMGCTILRRALINLKQKGNVWMGLSAVIISSSAAGANAPRSPKWLSFLSENRSSRRFRSDYIHQYQCSAGCIQLTWAPLSASL